MRSTYFKMVLAAFTVGTIAGCNGDPAASVPTVPVTGTVTYKGAPVEGALVAFVPTPGSSTKSANGTTDAQGKFTLKTYLTPTSFPAGAMEGEFNVTVIKKSGAGAASEGKQGDELLGDQSMNKAPSAIAENQGATSTALDNPGAKVEDLVPAKYGNPMTSGLTASVKKGAANDFPFNLED